MEAIKVLYKTVSHTDDDDGEDGDDDGAALGNESIVRRVTRCVAVLEGKGSMEGCTTTGTSSCSIDTQTPTNGIITYRHHGCLLSH